MKVGEVQQGHGSDHANQAAYQPIPAFICAGYSADDCASEKAANEKTYEPVFKAFVPLRFLRFEDEVDPDDAPLT